MANYYQPQPSSTWGGFQNQISPQMQYSSQTCNHNMPSYDGQQTYSQQPMCAQSAYQSHPSPCNQSNQYVQAAQHQQYAQSSGYAQQAQALQHQQAQPLQHQQAQPMQPVQHTQAFQHSQNAQSEQQTPTQPGAEPKMPPEAEAILKSMKNGFACPRGCIPQEMHERSMAPPLCPQTNNWNQRRPPQASNQNQNYPQSSYNSQSKVAQCNHSVPANFQAHQPPSLERPHSSEYLPHLGHMKTAKENTMPQYAQTGYSQTKEPHFSTVQNSYGNNTVQNLHEACTNQGNYQGEGEGSMYGTRSKSEHVFPIITGETTSEIQAVRKRPEVNCD